MFLGWAGIRASADGSTADRPTSAGHLCDRNLNNYPTCIIGVMLDWGETPRGRIRNALAHDALQQRLLPLHRWSGAVLRQRLPIACRGPLPLLRGPLPSTLVVLSGHVKSRPRNSR